jgi:hypothetical protein
MFIGIALQVLKMNSWMLKLFQMMLLKFRRRLRVADPQPSGPQDEASPEFTKDLEMTVHMGENPVQNVPLVETREDLPEGQDPSPSIVAFNKSFGTSYRGDC